MSDNKVNRFYPRFRSRNQKGGVDLDANIPRTEETQILNGKESLQFALTRQALSLDPSTRRHLLDRGEQLDPVLRHHLRLDRY